MISVVALGDICVQRLANLNYSIAFVRVPEDVETRWSLHFVETIAQFLAAHVLCS